jgi:hypothetical protein
MELLFALTYLGPLAAAVLVGLLSRHVTVIVAVDIVAVAVAAVPHALILKNWLRAGQDQWTEFLHRLALASALLIGISLFFLAMRMLITFIKPNLGKD